MELKTATPAEIDTELAGVHYEIGRVTHELAIAQNSVFHWAGKREYISATWQNRKGGYKNHGTYEEALEIVRVMWAEDQAHRANDYGDDTRPQHWGDHSRNLPFEGPEKVIARVEKAQAMKFTLWAEANVLEGEYLRRPWSRYFLVTSSAGHIHSSTHCHSCRLTTEYGWMPEMSGMSEADAIASLGTHADALCSVCFPTAPVATKRTNITKAQAARKSAGTYAAS